MKKKISYIVKIPTTNDEFIETRYNNAKEVGNYLQTSERTVYKIVNGECLYDNIRTKKLKNIIICKVDI